MQSQNKCDAANAVQMQNKLKCKQGASANANVNKHTKANTNANIVWTHMQRNANAMQLLYK